MNNREIKFRVWDFKSNKMMDHDWLSAASVVYDVICSNKRNDIAVMQYVGLKDKEGNEIYEGDVVVHDGEHCVVNFKNGNFGIDFQETSRKPYDRILSSTKWEVIGNIYQHPHLL